jgi:thiol-disulfide isomerase/thioredoxin|tara:strand:+ start:387 stop:785 length:399 start_codon:yes stop_codon:yes gene_type:complete
MIKQIEISSYIYVLIMLLVFGCSTAFGQTFINGNFKDRIAKDVVAVEFWADWNKHNEFSELSKLKECQLYRIDIMADADIQNEYNITAIPTVVIFDNGVEKCRFGANIMFQLEADKKTIQNSVDTIILNKFQ